VLNQPDLCLTLVSGFSVEEVVTPFTLILFSASSFYLEGRMLNFLGNCLPITLSNKAASNDTVDR